MHESPPKESNWQFDARHVPSVCNLKPISHLTQISDLIGSVWIQFDNTQMPSYRVKYFLAAIHLSNVSL